MRTVPGQGGWFELVVGPMMSGKSEELMRRLRRCEISGQRVLVVKPALDDRYELAAVVSHTGARMDAKVVSCSVEIQPLAASYDVIGIDEVQFFDPEIAEVIEQLVVSGLRVIASGLDLDYRGEPFGPIPRLLAQAEFVDKLQAVCVACGGPATRSQRLVAGRPASAQGPTIMVGAAESYEARCRACFEPPA